MTKKKVLIFGAHGRVGREVTEHCFKKCSLMCPTPDVVNIRDYRQVLHAFESFLPDLVINLAAITNVDQCEVGSPDPREWESNIGYQVNWCGALNICSACGEMKKKPSLVQVSTDYVFSGDKGSPYNEYDEVGPINDYGLFKMLAERDIGVVSSKYEMRSMVIRSSWIYGKYAPSFVEAVLKKAMTTTGEIQVVDDQIGSPTRATDLAQWIGKLINDQLWFKVVHLSNAGSCSRFDFAKIAMRYAGNVTSNMCFDEGRIVPVKTDSFPPKPARRPKNTALESAVLNKQNFGLSFRDWKEALNDHVQDLFTDGFFGG